MKSIISIIIKFQVFIIPVIISSCDVEDPNIEYPGYEPQLVIHSFISPSDTMISAHISSTQNIYGTIKEYPGHMDAKVSLVDGNMTIPFSEPDSLNVCSLKYQILPGNTYGITAECQGYPSTSANCTVPDSDDLSFQIDTFTAQEILYDYIYTFKNLKVTVQNGSDHDEYYRLTGSLTYFADYDTTMVILPFYEEGLENILSSTIGIFPGKSLEQFSTRIYIDPTDTFINSYHVKIILLKTDYDYYQFHLSQSRYSDSEDPFTEFSPIYSNFENGRGIFCSYLKYEDSIKIK